MPRLVLDLPPDGIKRDSAEIKQALAAIGLEVDVLNERAIKNERALERSQKAMNRLAAELDPAEKKVQLLARRQDELDRALKSGAITQERYNQLLAQVRSKVIGVSDALAKQKADFDRLAASIDPAIQKKLRLAHVQQELNRALAAGAVDQREYARLLGLAQSGLGGVTSSAMSLRSVLPGVFSAAGVATFVKELAAAKMELDRIESRLRVATGGDQAAGGRELEFVRAEAQRLGLDLKVLAREYSAVAVASRGTALQGQQTRLIFTALAEESAALGLSQQQLEKAFKAIQQMMSKGTVQAEELRGQLGDALPDAFQLAARAMGVSTGELNDMLKKGEVLASDLLPRLAAEMHKAYGDEAEGNATRLTGALNQVSNVLFEMKAALAEMGLAETITEGADAAQGALEGLLPLLREMDRLSREMSGQGVFKLLLTSPLMAVGQWSKRSIDEIRNQFPADWFQGPASADQFRAFGPDRQTELQNDVMAQAGGLKASLAAAQKQAEAAVNAAEKWGEVNAKAEAAAKAAAREQERVTRAYEKARGELDPLFKLTVDYQRDVESLKESLGGQAEAEELLNQLLAERARKYEAAKKAANELKLVEVGGSTGVISVVTQNPMPQMDDVAYQTALAAADTEVMARYLDEARQALEAMRTPQEILNQQREKYNLLLDAGLLSLDEHRRLMDDIEYQEWSVALEQVTNALGGIDGELGTILTGVVQIADAWKRVTAETATAADKLQGWADIATSVSAMGRDMGWWGPEGGTSKFGGSKDRNYADEGRAVGAVIGAVVGGIIGAAGTYGFGTAAGIQGGAAIGGALGEILGSMIKSGAAEGLARLELTAAGVETMITKDEGGLGDVIGDVGDQIIAGLDQAMAALNAELAGIPDVKLKVRGEHVSVLIGGVYAWFETMEEAVSFAMAEIMRQADYSGGISPSVKSAIEHSMGGSVEQLLSDIEFAIDYDRIGMDAVQVAVLDYLTEYRTNVERATQLGLDPSKYGQDFGIKTANDRNRILGIQETPEQRIRRESAAFNASMALLKAEETAKLADKRFKASILRAEIEMFRAEAGLERGRIEVRARSVDAQGELLRAEVGIVQVTLQQLAALEQAIAASEALLANLPALISEGEIEAAIRRARGGGGGGRGMHLAERRTAALEELLRLQRELVLGELSPYNARQKVDAARSEYERLKALAATGNVSALEKLPQAVRDYLELYREAFGSTGDYGDVFNDVNGFLTEILRRAGMTPITPFQQQAAANANEIARTFYKDNRGKLHTRNSELEERLDAGNIERRLVREMTVQVVERLGLIEENTRRSAQVSERTPREGINPQARRVA